MIEGFASLRQPRRAIRLLGWSFAVWIVNAASFWAALAAFDIPAPPQSALLIQAFVAFGVAVPSTPGYFGVFELAATAALTLYHVDVSLAASYAIGYHITTFIPITLLGLWSLRRMNLTLSDVAHVRERVTPES